MFKKLNNRLKRKVNKWLHSGTTTVEEDRKALKLLSDPEYLQKINAQYEKDRAVQ